MPRSMHIPSPRPGTWLEVGDWEETPLWHPMNWLLGWTHRQRIYLCGVLGDEPEGWNYGDTITVINERLEKRFKSYGK